MYYETQLRVFFTFDNNIFLNDKDARRLCSNFIMKSYFLELLTIIISSIFWFFHYLTLSVMNLLLTLSMGYHHESSTFPENYSFGTIETTNRIFDQTRIRLYNEKGEILDSIVVKIAGICKGFI